MNCLKVNETTVHCWRGYVYVGKKITLLLDFNSGSFLELERLNDTTNTTAIFHLQAKYTQIMESLRKIIAHNRPQYSSKESSAFAKERDFKCKTGPQES